MKPLILVVVLTIVSACWEPHTANGVAVRVPEPLTPNGPMAGAEKTQPYTCLFVYCPTNKITKTCTHIMGIYGQAMSDLAIDNTAANGTSFSSCGDLQTVTNSKLYMEYFK